MPKSIFNIEQDTLGRILLETINNTENSHITNGTQRAQGVNKEWKRVTGRMLQVNDNDKRCENMVRKSHGSACANKEFRKNCRNVCNTWKREKFHWIDSIKSSGYKTRELNRLYDSSIPTRFKNDRDVIVAALNMGVHMSKIPAMARDDADLMLDVLRGTHHVYDVECIRYISDRLKGDSTFMTQLLKATNPSAESIVQCASDSLKEDYEFMRLAVRSRKDFIVHASPRLLRKSPDIVADAVLAAANQHMFTHGELQQDDPAIRIALEQHSDNYRIMSFLVEQNNDLIHYASEKVRRRIDLIKTMKSKFALKTTGSAIP